MTPTSCAACGSERVERIGHLICPHCDMVCRLWPCLFCRCLINYDGVGPKTAAA